MCVQHTVVCPGCLKRGVDLFVGAVLTISDGVSSGHREDVSGSLIREFMDASGIDIAQSKVIPDEAEAIKETIVAWAPLVDLILTTGGTGLGPRDVTPEATNEVLERHIPGITEAMRIETLKFTPMAMLGRGLAGIRSSCLIVNLPGSPKAVRESLDVLDPVIRHALQVVTGDTNHENP